MAPEPLTEVERALEAAQRAITAGQLAEPVRRAAVRELYDKGMTQRELAERLTRASQAAGGPPVSENSVQKLLTRLRERPHLAAPR